MDDTGIADAGPTGDSLDSFRIAHMSLWALILIAATAMPPLTDTQRTRLDTAVDDSARLDESALYPLIENALTWDEYDETGATVPGYDALLNDPAAKRGELYLIEGRFAGRARRYNLVRSGQWGDALSEWVLLVRDDPEQVAVVYFVDPDEKLTPPSTGSSVRVVARFFKVWADRDKDGQPSRYLTFVARSPSVAAADSTGPVIWFLPMTGLILALAVLYLYVRRLSRPRLNDSDHGRHPAGSAYDAMLSQDPAESLRRLAEQHDEP